MSLLQSLLLFATSYFLQTACAQDSVQNVGIIGGHNAHIQDVPFIAAVLQDGATTCVGTIIHKSFILTSASCSTGNPNQVLVGTARLNRGGKLYDVEEAIRHHHYDPDTKVNDICLLKLKTKLHLGRKVTRVRLPEHNEVIADGTLFNVTGWGSLDNQGKKFPERLQQTTVPVISNESCNNVYGDVTDTAVCAFAPGHDGCVGDTGAPLTTNNVQFGILSKVNTKGCGIKPSIYTKVTKYVDWIQLMITIYND